MTTPAALQDASLALVTERVERLLLRYEEVQRTNELLKSQLATTQGECDQLKSRLAAARSRIDALLDRLPVHLPGHLPGHTPTQQSAAAAPVAKPSAAQAS